MGHRGVHQTFHSSTTREIHPSAGARFTRTLGSENVADQAADLSAQDLISSRVIVATDVAIDRLRMIGEDLREVVKPEPPL